MVPPPVGDVPEPPICTSVSLSAVDLDGGVDALIAVMDRQPRGTVVLLDTRDIRQQRERMLTLLTDFAAIAGHRRGGTIGVIHEAPADFAQSLSRNLAARSLVLAGAYEFAHVDPLWMLGASMHLGDDLVERDWTWALTEQPFSVDTLLGDPAFTEAYDLDAHELGRQIDTLYTAGVLERRVGGHVGMTPAILRYCRHRDQTLGRISR